ncbi:unnamed protein product [Staurois parvus]|uniref:Uncharacterized protein n=1 Tax=Staurois parvus TaxID=386267 RepID=A0ABN9G2Q9_9NEOB|nr:unnamed protein product [Staurois parvus]
MWANQRVNCVLFHSVLCECFPLQGADWGEICVVYTQHSSMLLLVGERPVFLHTGLSPVSGT